jgi:hypothetical protein
MGEPYHDPQHAQDCTAQANSLILRFRHPQGRRAITSTRLLATAFLLPLPSDLGRPEDDTSRANG